MALKLQKKTQTQTHSAEDVRQKSGRRERVAADATGEQTGHRQTAEHRRKAVISKCDTSSGLCGFYSNIF